MKKILSILFFTGFFINVFSQEKRIKEKDIPAQIIIYLQTKYPEKKETEYYKKKEKDTSFYEVEFELKKQVYNLKFSLTGNLLETEKEIEITALKLSVKDSINSILKRNFRKSKIKKIQEVDAFGEKQYEINAKVKRQKNNSQFKNGFYKIMLDKNGQLLRIEAIKLESIESVF